MFYEKFTKSISRLWNEYSILMTPIYRLGASIILRLTYRIDYQNYDLIPQHGPVLLIANHVSYVDGPIIQAGCKRPIRFLIDEYIYHTPIAHYFLKLQKSIPVLPKKENVAKALDEVSEALENNEVVCIFPEGQLTYTGQLGRFKPGIEWIIERDPVPIYPIALKGLWGSIYSRKYLKAKNRWIPKQIWRKVTAACGSEIHPENADINYLQRKLLALQSSMFENFEG